MGKSISQQVREKVREASAKAENGAPAENPEAASFISSATPAPNEPAADVTADAPEASGAPPLAVADAPSAEAPAADAQPAAETKTPTPSAEPTAAPIPATAASEEEWEDGEWDDDSVGVKYRIKAPKGMAEKIKAGWMAHADYSRKSARLAHFQNEFQPLIESGYMEKVLPFYRALNQDEVLANAVAHLYQQRMANQPLSYAQPGIEERVLSQPSQQPSSQEEQAYEADPYLQSIMQPIRSELGQLRSYLESNARSFEQQRIQAQQAEARRASELAEWRQIHEQLRQAYPGDFTGDAQDIPKLQQLQAYADRAGYTRETHGWYGRMLAAKQAIDRFSAPANAVATPSAGAAAVQAQAEEIARRARAEVANGTVVSGSSQPADPRPPKPPKTRDKDGKPLPVKEAMKNVMRAAMARAEAGSST